MPTPCSVLGVWEDMAVPTPTPLKARLHQPLGQFLLQFLCVPEDCGHLVQMLLAWPDGPKHKQRSGRLSKCLGRLDLANGKVPEPQDSAQFRGRKEDSGK